MSKVSIICPVLINATTKADNWSYLEKCVHSFKKNSKEIHEFIVVSNNGPFVQCPIEGIKQIHTERQGQCGAVNLGVKEAQNEYVMIIDEDFIFPLNWEELTEKAKEYDFVSGNLMERGGSFAICDCGSLLSFDEIKFESESLRMAKQEWENGFGFPLICKKSIWELVEGYDEQYDPWGSNCDSDIEYKFMLAGIMPRRWKGVLFYHFVSVSGTFAPENDGFWRANTRRFGEKWGIARAGSPNIWSCDFAIDGDRLKYKPSFAKLQDNPNVYYKKFEWKHVGWLSNNIDLFERFWCDVMGFVRIWESGPDKGMFKDLFNIDASGTVRRYEKDGITIEVHFFDPPAPEDSSPFYKRGINHICLLVDDRNRFLKIHPFETHIYNNPKGHQNIFIRDLEGNWIEIYQRM